MFAPRLAACLVVAMALGLLLLAPTQARAQENKVMGELQFSGTSKAARGSGVWIDGQYVGFLKELKGDKKIMLLPGEHEISVRQSGYKEFAQTILAEPGQVLILRVTMLKDPAAVYPSVTAKLKLDVEPERAAVFLDDAYIGHVREFDGAFRSLLVSPGKHRIKIALPGYRTFETEINLLAGQKFELKTELVKGSIEQAGALIKRP